MYLSGREGYARHITSPSCCSGLMGEALYGFGGQSPKNRCFAERLCKCSKRVIYFTEAIGGRDVASHRRVPFNEIRSSFSPTMSTGLLNEGRVRQGQSANDLNF